MGDELVLDFGSKMAIKIRYHSLRGHGDCGGASPVIMADPHTLIHSLPHSTHEMVQGSSNLDPNESLAEIDNGSKAVHGQAVPV